MKHTSALRRLHTWSILLASGLMALVSSGVLAQTDASDGTAQTAASTADKSGPIRLRTPAQTAPVDTTTQGQSSAPAAYTSGEFEQYVRSRSGNTEQKRHAEVRRLGADLMLADGGARSGELSPVVPADYVVSSGDEVQITLWGAVEGDLRLVVDRTGRISIPRVGVVQVAGVRNDSLAGVIERRISQVFKNFQLSVSLGQLRGVRVLVTGYVTNPGTYTVSALSTMVGVLMRAGGPAAAGSFRLIELRRQGQVVSRLDLYDLLLRGDRSADITVLPGDVVHVTAVGPQVGVIGSVNRPVVAELVPRDTLKDVLAMAGGFSPVADTSRVMIERLQDRLNQRIVEVRLPQGGATPLTQGDVVRIFSATETLLSNQHQNKRVRVEGEVGKPGEYILPPAASLGDAIRIAGGLSDAAYLFGTQFTRERVRISQQENYERALRDLETDLTRSTGAQRVSSTDQVAQGQAQVAANARLLDRLRALRPNGRVVLQLTPTTSALPDLALEDGDSIYIPPRPTTVGVFGSVYNAGSYLHTNARYLGDYLRLAGGPTKGADQESIFVIRANGQVVSNRQGSQGFFSRTNIADATVAEPGDTIFVPEEMDKTTWMQAAKDWTQLLYQFGIGIAGIKSAIN
ncbi:SLBB domain-containing protein [Ideonella sp. DXS22W]|uniref:SLBB domain-containing protein n=1 Tax=Pseudaquabacterium inlustre TaxID=2984192 RepID=A0ABU9CDE2_9BURK